MLVACAAQPSPIPRPTDGEFLSYAERIELVVACVRSHGFDASSQDGFGVFVEHGIGQEERASRVEGQCWEEVEDRFPAPPALSREERYFYYLEVADCLRGIGYDIPDAPSLESYLDQPESFPSDAAIEDILEVYWDPYLILALRGVDTFKLQSGECPPAPWAR